jgi:hypothetical protein
MKMRNSQVAAAVAAALAMGGYGAAFASPTPAQAMAPAHSVFMAGSSAAANAVINYLEGTLCGGTGYSVFTTPTSSVGLPDFRAVSCTAASGQFGAGTLVTVWYRPEGGSVVGVFPVVNNTQVKQLNMNTAGCTGTNGSTTAYGCTAVQGTTPGNGTNDSFGPTGVQSHNVDIGVSDLEPGVFANPTIGATNSWAGGGNNDPANPAANQLNPGHATYATSITGVDLGVDNVQTFSNPSFGQAFGFIVNTSVHNAGVTDLPKQQIAALFDVAVTNWNQVTLANNTAVSLNAPQVICNREIGSGTRAETDIFLNNDGCINAAVVLPDLAGTSIGSQVQPTDNFQTIAELDCVNKTANSIGYVSIDNFAKTGAAASTSFPNAWPITIDGVANYPGNGGTADPAGNGALQAALGAYDDWYEASLNLNNSASADGSTFYNNFLIPALQSLNANVGTSYQVLAIPDAAPGNKATSPPTVGSHNVYVNEFTRGGNSCHVPSHG